MGTWDGAIDDGPVTLDVSPTGSIAGTLHSNAANVDGPVTGTIQNNGSTAITVTFPDEAPAGGSGTLVLADLGASLQGVLTFSGDPVTFVMTGP